MSGAMQRGIVCSLHGGCSPDDCFDLHHPPTEKAEPSAMCGPCRIGEHEWCDHSDRAGRLDRCCCGVVTKGLGERADPDGNAWTRAAVGEDAYCDLTDTIDPGADEQ